MNGLNEAAPAIAMLAAIAFVIGGIALLRRGGVYRRKGGLMLVMAAVLVANVAIWTL